MEPLSSSPAAPPTPGPTISAVIPCLDEEEAIGAVVRGVLSQGVAEVIVVDGGSTDGTVESATAAGARVIVEPKRGYGRAIRSGVAAVRGDATIVLFIDGDGSDRTELIPALIDPIADGRADFVLGSRLRGDREPRSLSRPQIVAGYLAGALIRVAYGVHFTDMSPFRAIRREVLDRLGMQEETFGWNLEMLMRVASSGARCLEIPVGQRRRAGGVSKVSGDLRASLRAAAVIATTFARLTRELRERDCKRSYDTTR